MLAALRELGLEDETALFFTTDHGSFEGSHRLNDKGPAAYDDIYRIPFPCLVKLPGVSGGRNEELVTLMDLAATFIDLAGVSVPDYLDGRSILPLIRGEQVSDWRQEVFMEFHGHQVPYPQRTVRTKDYKLIANLTDQHEFYDLRKDPAELRDLIRDPSYEEIRQDLYTRLCRHLENMKDDTAYQWLRKLYLK